MRRSKVGERTKLHDREGITKGWIVIRGRRGKDGARTETHQDEDKGEVTAALGKEVRR